MNRFFWYSGEWSLTRQVRLGFSVALVLVIAVCAALWWIVLGYRDDIGSIYITQLRTATQLAEAESALWRLRYGVPQFMLGSANDQQQILVEQDKYYALIEDRLAEYNEIAVDQDERRTLTNLRATYLRYKQARPKFFELWAAGKTEEAITWRALTASFGAAVVRSFDEQIALQRTVSVRRHDEASGKARLALAMITVITVVLMGLIGVGFAYSLRILRPIKALRAQADRVVAEQFSESVEAAASQNEVFALVRSVEIMSERLLAHARSLRKLSLAVEQNPNLIVMTDVSGIIEYVNHSFCRLTGYSEAEVLGRTPRFLKSSETAAAVWDELWRTILAGNEWRGEIKNRNRDGTAFWFSVVISPVRDGSDAITHFVAMYENITERKMVETARQAKDRAEAASRAKSDFLATMSHEIRTPMNVIIGYVDNLRQGLRDADQIAQLDRIDRAANHLLGIIDDVLDMAKIEAGKLSIDVAKFSLRTLLSGVKDVFLSQMEGKGLTFRLDVAAELPEWLQGDALRLKQCLFNYLSNALKFTEKGSVTVDVGLDSRSEAGLLLHFEVEDSGIGVEPEVLPQLFAPFEQADMSTTRRFGGTGLGLALTKQLATLMGGEVGVDSIPGRGSRFWFTALLQPADASPIEGAKRRDVPPALNFAGVRILVAEDTKTNREVMRHLLSNMELQVDMAENGKIAVEMAGATAYHLILMDMRMPVMDGLSATRIIRTLPNHAETPIVALTANAFDEDRQRCLDAGMNDFLAKPLRLASLKSTLSKWVISVALDK